MWVPHGRQSAPEPQGCEKAYIDSKASKTWDVPEYDRNLLCIYVEKHHGTCPLEKRDRRGGRTRLPAVSTWLATNLSRLFLRAPPVFVLLSAPPSASGAETA